MGQRALLALAALLLLSGVRAGGPLRRPASLLEVGDGLGSGEEDAGSGSGDAEGGSGSDSGSGSGSGAAAAAAAVSAAAKDMKKSLQSSEGLVKDLKSVHQKGAINNRELTRQIKVLADTLNPPKTNGTGPPEKESDSTKCKHRSCSECVMDEECGWCITKKQCVHGDKNHPFSAVCVDWTFDACPFGCENYASCDECVTDEGCSWCQDDCGCRKKGFGACDRAYKGKGAMCPAAATCPNSAAPPVMPIIPKLNELKTQAAMAQAVRENAATPQQGAAAGLTGQGSAAAPAAGSGSSAAAAASAGSGSAAGSGSGSAPAADAAAAAGSGSAAAAPAAL